MRPIDIVALAGAILAVFTFLSASGAFQRGRTARGALTLALGAVLFLAAAGAGAVSVGTEGYRPLAADSAMLAATLTAEPLGPDSVRARLAYPDGVTHTFRLAGSRVRIGARILRWKTGAALVGRAAEYELARIAGSDGDGEAGASGAALDIGASRPVDVYDLVRRFASLRAVVEIDSGEVDVPAAHGAEFRLEVTRAGVRAERIGR